MRDRRRIMRGRVCRGLVPHRRPPTATCACMHARHALRGCVQAILCASAPQMRVVEIGILCVCVCLRVRCVCVCVCVCVCSRAGACTRYWWRLLAWVFGCAALRPRGPTGFNNLTDANTQTPVLTTGRAGDTRTNKAECAITRKSRGAHTNANTRSVKPPRKCTRPPTSDQRVARQRTRTPINHPRLTDQPTQTTNTARNAQLSERDIDNIPRTTNLHLHACCSGAPYAPYELLQRCTLPL